MSSYRRGSPALYQSIPGTHSYPHRLRLVRHEALQRCNHRTWEPRRTTDRYSLLLKLFHYHVPCGKKYRLHRGPLLYPKSRDTFKPSHRLQKSSRHRWPARFLRQHEKIVYDLRRLERRIPKSWLSTSRKPTPRCTLRYLFKLLFLILPAITQAARTGSTSLEKSPRLGAPNLLKRTRSLAPRSSLSWFSARCLSPSVASSRALFSGLPHASLLR